MGFTLHIFINICHLQRLLYSYRSNFCFKSKKKTSQTRSSGFNKSFIIVQNLSNFIFSNNSKTTALSDLKYKHNLEDIVSLYALSALQQLV